MRVGGQKERAITVPSSWRGNKAVVSPSTSLSTLASSKDFSSSTSDLSLSFSTSSGSSHPQIHTPTGERTADPLASFDLAQRFRDASNKAPESFDNARSTPVAAPACSTTEGEALSCKSTAFSTPTLPLKTTRPQPVTDRILPPTTTSGVKLISLCEAQDRERRRRNCTAPAGAEISLRTPFPDPASFPIPERPSTPVSRTPGSHHIKGKKSGFMKMLNRTPRSAQPAIIVSSPVQLVETPSAQPLLASVKLKQAMDMPPSEPRPIPQAKNISRTLMPQLELRPVSMNFASGLPLQYLSQGVELPPLPPKTAHSPAEDRHERLVSNDPSTSTSASMTEQSRIIQLEEQIRSMKHQLKVVNERLHERRASESACSRCGHSSPREAPVPSRSIMDRARVKTSGGRGVFGASHLLE